MAAFPTSYIPTTTAQVVRAADVCDTTDVTWYNSATSTSYLDHSDQMKDIGKNAYSFALSDGTLNNRNTLLKISSGGRALRVVSGGVAGVSITDDQANYVAGQHKAAIALQVNDYAYYRNGAQGIVDNLVAVPVGVSKLSIGIDETATGNFWNGHIAAYAFWNTRKSNEFLAEITS